LTILSITTAHAAPKSAASSPAAKVNPVACSISGGGFGTYPSGCRNWANYKSYNECKEAGVKRGWSTKIWVGTAAAWGCKASVSLTPQT